MDFEKEIQGLLADRLHTMQDFTSDHKPMAMYAIYRDDLDMSAGKLSAQCGHAFDLAMEAATAANPDIRAQYRGTGNGTKLVMYAKNQGQLLRAYQEARAAGLPCALIIDRGHVIPGTPFDGKPIITAVGIGPCYKADATGITKRYTLCK